jgi:hypothetical protein
LAVDKKDLPIVKILLETGEVDVLVEGHQGTWHQPDPLVVTPLQMAERSRSECPGLFDWLINYAQERSPKKRKRTST